MYIQLITLLFCAITTAFPLNINLGAFSPALVVGDGEISFGEAKEAEGLVNTLAGASAGTGNVAAGGGEGAGAAAAERRSTRPAESRSSKAKSDSDDTKVKSKRASKNPEREHVKYDLSTLEAEVGKLSLKRSLKTRDLAGFSAALKFADGALTKGPSIDLGTGNGGSGVGITVRPPGT